METLQIFQKTPWRQVNREIIRLDFEAMKSFFFLNRFLARFTLIELNLHLS